MRYFAVFFWLLLNFAGSLPARAGQDSSLASVGAIRAAFDLYEKTGEVRHWETAFRIAESRKKTFLNENIQRAGNRHAAGPGNKQTGDRDRRRAAGAGSSQAADAGTTGRPSTVIALQSLLRDQETAVLSYSSGPDEIYIFLTTGETFYAARLPVREVFFNRLGKMKASLQTRKDFQKTIAHQLYRKLVTPVKPYLQGKTHLVIIPDEETGLIPFEALVPDTASGRFLLHDYAVSYAYSASSLINFRSPLSITDRQKVLALAPFNVPSSEKEIMNIKADHVLGSDASREQFFKKARDYPIIHLATYAAITDPLHSFIGFNGGGTTKNTASRLFTRDIYGMDLKKVDLLILSRCQVPEKRPASLSGLITMAHALAQAGCPNFITSLWDTEMNTSGMISMKLHQYIHKGYGYARALQQARIDYLVSPGVEEQFKSPGYWAGFILIGEINTVPQSHKFFYYFALAFTVLVVVYILRRKNHRCRHAEYPEYP